MKSIKLSKLIRKQIVDSMSLEFSNNYFLNTEFSNLSSMHIAKEESHIEAMCHLWEECYSEICKKRIAHIPKELLSGQAFSVCAGNNFTSRILPSMPGVKHKVDMIISDKHWSECFTKYDKICDLIQEYNKSHLSFVGEVSVIIDSVTTTKKLVELWPSAQAFLPAYIADPDKGINLPALTISRLDEKLKGATN